MISADSDALAERYFARYDALMRDERHRQTAYQALRWALHRTARSDVEELVKDVFLSSVFDAFCAPSVATPEQRFLDMKFLLFFFSVDDSAPERIEALLARLNHTSADHRDESRDETMLLYEDLRSTLSAMSADSHDFHSAVVEMCESMHAEKTLDKTAMTEDELRRLRKHTIAVPAHSEWWRAILGVSFSAPVREKLRQSALLDAACELIYLVNDIGSVERDRETARADPMRADPNYVLLRARLSGDLSTATEDVIALHNARLEDFRRIEGELRASELGDDLDLLAYVAILRGMVRGNLQATRYLAPLRYPGVDAHLAKLDAL